MRGFRRRVCSVAVACVCCAPVVGQEISSRYTIAFKAFPPSNTEIFIAAGDGTGARPLAANPALDYNASLSPDGRWIVFTSHRAGSADLYRIRPDGSTLERLTADDAFDDQATFSPDGQQVAFVSSRGGQADVWTLDLATRRAHRVTSHPAGDFRPAWSPDGQWLAFSSDRDPPVTSCPNTTRPGPGPFVTPQYTSVFVARSDGSNLRRVTAATESAGSPRWSVDGSRLLAYTAPVEEVCAGGLMFGRGPSQIVSIDWRTSNRELLTDGPGLKAFPGPLAAGRFAAAVSSVWRSRGHAIRRLRSANLTDESIEQGTPVWTPTKGARPF
jgi:TolB protein